MNKRTFWLLALAAGVGPGLLEMMAVLFEYLLWDTMILDGATFGQAIRHWGLTIGLWGFFAVLLGAVAKRCDSDIFRVGKRPGWQAVTGVLILTAILTVVSFVSWDFRFKPVAEFMNMGKRYGSNGIYAFVMQYVYYLFEMVLAFLCIVFGQKAGELSFPAFPVPFPWGGMVLGLSWGILHVLSKGVGTGIQLLVSSLVYGVAYLLLQKNPRYAYPVIWLMFVL